MTTRRPPPQRTFLRDIGSGQGFMLPPTVFYYSGRRSYLYDEDMDQSTLDPPPDFMSKAQIRKLHRLADSRGHLVNCRKLRAIRWVRIDDAINTSIQRPATTGNDGYTQRKPHNNEKTPYGLLLRVGAPRARVSSLKPPIGDFPPGALSAAAAATATAAAVGGGGGGGEEGEGRRFIMDDWEPLFEAGVRFYYNGKTGECRQRLPVKKSATEPPRATGRPNTAPGSLDGTSGGAATWVRGGGSMGRGATRKDLLQQQVVLEEDEDDVEDDTLLTLEKHRQGLEMGMGAKIYDPTELSELLSYLEANDYDHSTRAKGKLRAR